MKLPKVKLNKKYWPYLAIIMIGIVLFFGALGMLGLYSLGGLEVANEIARKLIISDERHTASHFEEATIIDKKDLELLINFARSQEKSHFSNVDQLEQQEILKCDSKICTVRKAFQIDGPIINQCERFRCLHTSVPFAKLSPHLWQGLMGIEDIRFLDHSGIDFISILRALVADLRAMSLVQGGSTLTQQLVKNLFLSNDKKFTRKIKEVFLALYIERNYSKEQIISLYFNEVFWGVVDGIYIKGIDVAARIYFGKRPQDLTGYESSILVGMLKGPYHYGPLQNPQRLVKRANIVWKKLKQTGMIALETKEWSEQQWDSWLKKLREFNDSGVLSRFYKLEKSKYLSPYEQLTLYKSIDVTKKQLAEKIKDRDIAVKVIVMNAKCQFYPCAESFSYYSKLERNKTEAISTEAHQVGSILKPIIYHIMVDQGLSLDDEVKTEAITLHLKSGDWTPRENSQHIPKKMTLREALQKSRNIPLIRSAKNYGFDKLEKTLIEYLPRLQTPLAEYPAQLLGAIELSMQEVANSYLHFLASSCKKLGDEELLEEQTVLYTLSDANLTTIKYSSREFFKGQAIFGKTGTSNKGLDNWFVAFDGVQLYLIWLGIETGRELGPVQIGGSSSAFKIFQEFVAKRGLRPSELGCYSYQNP